MSRFSRYIAPSAGDARASAVHGQVCMVASAFMFAALAVSVRSLAGQIPPAQIAVIRFGLGLVGAGVIIAARPDLFQATRLGGLAMRGLVGGVAVLLYFVALGRLGAGMCALLNNTYPVWAVLFAIPMLGERMTGRIAMGLVIAMMGLVLVVGLEETRAAVGGLASGSTLIGMAAGTASGLLGGGATTIVRALRRTESAMAIFVAFCLGGLCISLPLAWSGWRPMHGHYLTLLLVGASSLGGQFLYTYAMKYVSAAGASTNLLTVVISYALASAFLGEAITAHALVGGIVVAAGVLVVSASERVRDHTITAAAS